MNTTTASAPGQAVAHACPKADLIERRLKRFQPRLQDRVSCLAARHPRLADLAVSFPALAVQLASVQEGRDEETIALAIAGAPLAALSASAGLPLWVRKLPPEAFAGAIPKLPGGELVSRQIVNHLPRSPKRAPIWMQAVSDAHAVGTEAVAVWIAREVGRGLKPEKLKNLRLVSLWAWYCGRPQCETYGTIEVRWQPAFSFEKALSAARLWHRAAALYLELGGEPIADDWLQPGTVDGFDIRPIRSVAEVMAEAAAMRNCLREYGYKLSHNRARLWSISQNGERVATLEVARAYSADPQPQIVQLRGMKNRTAPPEVWWAVRRWINMHELAVDPGANLKWGAAALDRRTWQSFWRPYWRAKQRIPAWLPLRPCRDALYAL